jgi:hypothetical protein
MIAQVSFESVTVRPEVMGSLRRWTPREKQTKERQIEEIVWGGEK